MIFLDTYQMFFTAYSLHSLKLFQFKTEEQTILTKKLTKKLQNYNQNSHSSRVSLIALALNNPVVLLSNASVINIAREHRRTAKLTLQASHH